MNFAGSAPNRRGWFCASSRHLPPAFGPRPFTIHRNANKVQIEPRRCDEPLCAYDTWASLIWVTVCACGASHGPARRAPGIFSTSGSRRICETLPDQILARTYGTDGVLQSSRSLANELGVSRSTVTMAYEQSAAKGFIDVRRGERPRVARSVVSEGMLRSVASPPTRELPLSEFGKLLGRIHPNGPVHQTILP